MKTELCDLLLVVCELVTPHPQACTMLVLVEQGSDLNINFLVFLEGGEGHKIVVPLLTDCSTCGLR